MIMATIMMIGMALMALKMKIACSRFLCALCRPDTGPLLLCVRVSLARCVCVRVCVLGGNFSRCVCVCVCPLCAIFCCFICSSKLRGEGKEGSRVRSDAYNYTLSTFDFITLICMYVMAPNVAAG